jgi:hypothetical protein
VTIDVSVQSILIKTFDGLFAGSLLPQFGTLSGCGSSALIVNAISGALVFLLVAKLFRGGGGWPRGRLLWRPWEPMNFNVKHRRESCPGRAT